MKTTRKQLQILAASAAITIWMLASPLRASGPDAISFNLVANPKFVQCLAADPYVAPTALVTVSRGTANDVMVVELRNFKPGSAFDLFTIQRTNLKSNDTIDP